MIAKQKALEKLHTARANDDQQLAAGIAHELNNAINVVNSKFTTWTVMIYSEEVHPEASQFFDFGLMHGQKTSSSEARITWATTLKKKICIKTLLALLQCYDSNWRFICNRRYFKALAETQKKRSCFWQMGCDLHGLRLASRHTVGIVKSVKQLGRVDIDTEEGWY